MNPEHLKPDGPWAYRRIRPGVKNLQYIPEEVGPQNETVNIGSQPYWEKNEDEQKASAS